MSNGGTGGPWFAALTAVLGGLAGMLGSVFSEDIKSSFPFDWLKGIGNVNGIDHVWQSTLFWTVLFLFGLCFYLSIRAQTKENRTAVRDLTENTQTLETLIRTLPEQGFLDHFEEHFLSASEQAGRAKLSGASSEDIEVAIVTCLTAIGHLARLFDRQESSFRYAIHVMVFTELPKNTEDLEKLRQRIQFTEDITDAVIWRGVLDSCCNFSLVIDQDGNPTLDDYAKPFTMPVPLKEFRCDNGKPTVLPGAIEAFCYPDRTVKLPDTSQLEDWFKNISGFRPSISEEIQHYFSDGPGREICSLVSFPFGSSGCGLEGYEDEPLGVVSIHSNSKDILKGEGLKLFLPLTMPFRLMLGELFKLRPAAE